MPLRPRFLLDLPSFGQENIEAVFSQTRIDLKNENTSRTIDYVGATAALLFFEPSTRTRMSFETVCHQLGLGPLVFLGGAGTSMEKGESVEDAILNVAAMDPKVMIVRCGDAVDLRAFAQKLPMPIISGGWGQKGHPTQALLDFFTLQEKRSLSEYRILYVGDVIHSRVFSSHLEMLKIYGGEFAVCGPSSLLPSSTSIKRFEKIEEGLKWANVVYALRYQLERHEKSGALSGEEIATHFGLRTQHLKFLSKEALIMHPGPVNKGMEMDEEIYSDSRSLILDQVRNGVRVRKSLIRTLLK